MKKRWKYMALSLIMLISVAGCGYNKANDMEIITENTKYVRATRGEVIENYSLSFDIIGGSDVMPIGSWWGPYVHDGESINGVTLPNYYDDYFFELAKNSGINVFTVNPNIYASYVQETIELLKKCEEYNIGIFVNDARLRDSSDNAISKIRERVSEYYMYDSCLGVHMTDEPLANRFDDIAKIYRAYDELGIDNKYLYTNMLGASNSTNYNYSGDTSLMNYEEYLNLYLEKVQPKFLSYDHYLFKKQNDSIMNSAYFTSLSIVREFANANKIPFWVFVQAGGQHEEYEIETKPVFPNEAEMLWNVNTSLAYGAKSIQYFTFLQPKQFTYALNGERDYTRNGMVGAMGNINEWYYYAQKANKQIAAIDHVLMNAASMGIIKGGVAANTCIIGSEVIESGQFRELIGVEASDYIIGCFDYFGETALYVVNNSVTEKNDIKLIFSDKYGYDIIQRAEKFSVAGKTITLTMEKGEGVLITLKY